MVPSIDGKWGDRDENGTFNGMIGMVQAKVFHGLINLFLQELANTHAKFTFF